MKNVRARSILKSLGFVKFMKFEDRWVYINSYGNLGFIDEVKERAIENKKKHLATN